MEAKKRSRIISILLLIAVIAAVVIVVALFRTDGESDKLSFTGEVEATEVEISSRVFGRIEWLCCEAGAQAKAGNLAVRIENNDLKSREAEAQAALVSSKKLSSEAAIGVENAKLQKEASEFEAKAAYSESLRAAALHNDAKNNLARARDLFEKGYMPKRDYDSAETAYATTAAGYRSAIARKNSADMAVKNALVNIKGAEARLESAIARVTLAGAQLKVVQTSIEETELKFPSDGVVSYKSFEAGENVSPGASIYTMHDMNNLRVRFDVEESVVHKIRLHDSATIELPGDSKPVYTGRVVEIAAVAGFATQRDVTRGRSDIKTFRVKAALPNPEGVLKPGMTVKATVYYSNNPTGTPGAKTPMKKAEAPEKLKAVRNAERPKAASPVPAADMPENAKATNP